MERKDTNNQGKVKSTINLDDYRNRTGEINADHFATSLISESRRLGIELRSLLFKIFDDSLSIDANDDDNEKLKKAKERQYLAENILPSTDKNIAMGFAIVALYHSKNLDLKTPEGKARLKASLQPHTTWLKGLTSKRTIESAEILLGWPEDTMG